VADAPAGYDDLSIFFVQKNDPQNSKS